MAEKEIAQYGLEKARQEFAEGPQLSSRRSLDAVRQMIRFFGGANRSTHVKAIPAVYQDIRFCVTRWAFHRGEGALDSLYLLLSGFHPSSPNTHAIKHMVKALRCAGFSEQMTELLVRMPQDAEFTATTEGPEETLTLVRPREPKMLARLLADFGLSACRWFGDRYASDLVELDRQTKLARGDTSPEPPMLSSEAFSRPRTLEGVEASEDKENEPSSYFRGQTDVRRRGGG